MHPSVQEFMQDKNYNGTCSRSFASMTAQESQEIKEKSTKNQENLD